MDIVGLKTFFGDIVQWHGGMKVLHSKVYTLVKIVQQIQLFFKILMLYVESLLLRYEKQPLGGAIVVTVDSGRADRLDVEVLWAHTTDSMCLGYMCTTDMQAKVSSCSCVKYLCSLKIASMLIFVFCINIPNAESGFGDCAVTLTTTVW